VQIAGSLNTITLNSKKQMLYFNTLEEKEQFYISGNLRIDKFSDFLETIQKLSKTDTTDTLFRGQCEAKYMLYSSLQRLWDDKLLKNHYESYRQLINNLIQNCRDWNSGIITKYLKNTGGEENELSYLSIMQHYGVPTPLLDFTYDINKSLYFATENVDFSPPNQDIDNYISVYYIFKRNFVIVTSNFFINAVLLYAKENNIIKQKDLDLTMQFDMILIDNTDQAYRIQNNLNILNQNGAFILNSSPTDPLEMHYLNWVKLMKIIIEKRGDNIKPPEEIGGCLNINKKLTKDIKEYLKENGIDKSSMYPDLNQLRIDCIDKEWQNFKKIGK
jgi:hypothetical protein